MGPLLCVSLCGKGAERERNRSFNWWWKSHRMLCVYLLVETVLLQAIPNLFTPGLVTSTRCGILRVRIFSGLSATFVFINPVMDLCVVHVRERNDESRSPPSYPNHSIGNPPAEPGATNWLVCVIGLVDLLCSPPISVG